MGSDFDNNDDEKKNDDNVISFIPRSQFKKSEEQNSAPHARKPPKHPPMFNIPPVTKYLTGIILAIYAILWGISATIFPQIMNYVVFLGGFTSANWTGELPFWWWTVLTPLTAIFLHGSWMHVGVNALMLVAIGSGAEKWLGPKRYLILFFLSSCIALLTHLAFEPFSQMPIVGASGGVSGLFGAVLLGFRTDPNGTSGMNANILPVIIVWVAISALMGFLGAPDGSNIAWVAHIGGFLGGIGIASMMIKKSRRR